MSFDPDEPIVSGDLTSAVAAGRLLVERRDAALAARASFAIETTLSGSSPLRMMRDAKHRGYGIRLVFVATADVEIAIERVRLRVTHGGHDVPVADIRRRYRRSLQNMTTAIAIADDVLAFDNSGTSPVLIASREDGNWTFASEPLPKWFADSLAGHVP